MRRPIVVVGLSALRLTAGCGETESQPDATATDAAMDVLEEPASSVDASAETLPSDAGTETQWPIVYNIVDGGGDSAMCYVDGNIVQACCNDQYCRGFCILDDDGGIECNCYGISGGCVGDNEATGLPNVCCSTVRGCEWEPFCNPQK